MFKRKKAVPLPEEPRDSDGPTTQELYQSVADVLRRHHERFSASALHAAPSPEQRAKLEIPESKQEWVENFKFSVFKSIEDGNPMLLWSLISLLQGDQDGLEEQLLQYLLIAESSTGKGDTLLHRAVMLGRLDCICILLGKGAPATRDSKQRFPLHYAAACNQESFSTLKLLLACQYGLEINAVDYRGQTALHHACRKGNLRAFQLLLSRGADSSILDYKGRQPIALLRKQEDKEEYIQAIGDTPEKPGLGVVDETVLPPGATFI